MSAHLQNHFNMRPVYLANMRMVRRSHPLYLTDSKEPFMGKVVSGPVDEELRLNEEYNDTRINDLFLLLGRIQPTPVAYILYGQNNVSRHAG